MQCWKRIKQKVQEMIAKAKACAKVFEDSESGDGKLFPQTEARP